MARMDDQLVFEVQRLYPQIYLACHIDHVRARSTKWGLSSHDASFLAHLDVARGSSPRSLAAHLGVVPSTLSATLKRLEKLGYISTAAAADDKRRRDVFLTTRGAEAIASTSVLDAEKVKQTLERLSDVERNAAVKGLRLLAQAANELSEENGK
jgi:MarR family transcriptional regulator, organic hydroperoxide resistance regulator